MAMIRDKTREWKSSHNIIEVYTEVSGSNEETTRSTKYRERIQVFIPYRLVKTNLVHHKRLGKKRREKRELVMDS